MTTILIVFLIITSVVVKSDNKITKIQKWLKNYYKKEFLDNIDFEIVVKDVPQVVKDDDKEDITEEKEVTNGDNCEEILISGEVESQEMSENDTNGKELEPIDTKQEEDEELNDNIVYNLELILLLVSIIFYKVRNLFPKLLDYLEFAWIYLQEFEARLEAQVLTENLIELLQNEFISQRNSNKMRSEVLSNEIIQLNAMIENLEKQYEDETRELIYLQNATIIGHNSGSGHSRQLTKLMNLKSGPPKELKIYTCSECGKQFKNAYKLNRHQYVHRPDTEKPYAFPLRAIV